MDDVYVGIREETNDKKMSHFFGSMLVLRVVMWIF